MTELPIKIDLRPDVKSLNQFKTQGYTEWWAIAEFVDNSISSFVQKERALRAQFGADFRLVVSVLFDEVEGTIEVSDNAAGIADADMQTAFSAGSPPSDKSSLSQFGLGMKAAGLWFADILEVTTHALGESKVKRVTINLDEIMNGEVDSASPLYLDASNRAVGTTVTLRKLSRTLPIDTGKGGSFLVVKEFLASIYRDFLRRGVLDISVEARRKNGKNLREVLTFLEPPFLVAPDLNDESQTPIEWRKEIAFETPSGKVVTGWAGLRAAGSYQNTGLVLLWRGKVIIGAGSSRDVRDGSASTYKPAVIFGSQNSAVSLRLVGEFDVSDYPSTNRKDDLQWSTDEKIEFEDALKVALNEPPLALLKMANGHRVAEKTPDVVNLWKEAVDNTARAAQGAIDNVEEILPAQVLREIEITESSADWGIEGVIGEYSYVSGAGGDLVTIEVGFGTFQTPETYLLRLKDDSKWLVTINRESKFARNFLDPRVSDVGAFSRLFASLAIAEIVNRDTNGDSNAGRTRRYLNHILDSTSMSALPGEIR